MRLALTADVEAGMVAHAQRSAPEECCGLLIGADHEITEAWPALNAADEPQRRYLVDPRDHLKAIRHARQRGLEVIGAYHSHPRSPAQPSATDASQAFGEFFWLILSLASDPPHLTAWWWDNGNFIPVTLVRSPEGKA